MQLQPPEQKVSKMKKFRELAKESRVEDVGFNSNAARTLREKPNKEPMPKLKEEVGTPPIGVRSLYTKMYAKHGGTASKAKDAQSKAYSEVEKKHGKEMRNSLEAFHKKNMNEAVKDKFDIGEYDQEGDMAKSDLRSILANAKRVHDMLEDDDNLPEWVQSKITKAEDYMSTVANYMEAEMNEEVELDEISQNLALNTYAKRAAKASSSGSKEDQKKADTMIGRIGKRWTADAQRRAWNRADKLVYGTKKEEVEMLDELDKEPGGTLHRYLASPKQRQRRIKAAIENPDKLKKINKGMRSAETKIEKERQKQTGMNPQYQPPPPTPRQIQKMDMRYTNEQTESVPASKALQKAHDDERKKRGLPDPSYYLELMKKKKQEIEDMKKEEVGLDEKITVMPAGTPNTGIRRVKLPSGGTITTGSIARGSTTRPAPSPMIANRKKPMVKEDIEQLDEKNKPTNPELWSRAVSMAKSKFDVYPSAYANGWAAKWYKEKGGGWKSVKEETELDEGYYKSQETDRQETERLSKRNDLPFTPDKPKKKSVVVGKKPEGYSIARQLARQAMKKYLPVKEAEERGTEPFLKSSRKAEIVKGAAKKGQKSDKFVSDPVLSSTVTRNN
jgi:hypothetical protein